jgi:hypothetical protein
MEIKMDDDGEGAHSKREKSGADGCVLLSHEMLMCIFKRLTCRNPTY